MQIREMAPIRLLSQAIGWKTLGFASVVLALLFFGDALLPLLGHGLYLLVEFVEQGSEDLLEFVFGVSTREAQILIVWVGLPVIGYFLWHRWLRKALAAVQARWFALADWINSDWSLEDWLRIGFWLALLGVAFSLM